MKKTNIKNYCYFAILILVTILLTLILSKLYLSKTKINSKFYDNINKITSQEFDEYIIENPDVIIYISNKYDLTNEKFEDKFLNYIDELNINNKLIYIDKSNIDKKFKNKLKEKYNINLDLNKLPAVIVMVDRMVTEEKYINNNSSVKNLINYEVFK